MSARARASAAAAVAMVIVGGTLAVAGCEQVLGIGPVPEPALDATSDVVAPSDAGVVAPSDAGDDGDAGPSTCGAFGQPCCDGGCSGGTQCIRSDAGSRCVAFAGTFETAFSNACGVLPCVNPNPLTGTCACPTSAVQQSSNFDVGCNDVSTAPSHLFGNLGVCGISTMPEGTDWAGAYLTADIAACEPGLDAGCITPNAITGTCGCPSVDGGIEEVRLRVFVAGSTQDGGCQNGALGGTLGVCLPRGVKPTTLAGVFEKDALGVCRVRSSSLTDCTCPPTTTPDVVRTIEEAPEGCSTNPPCTFPQTTITFCMGT